MLCRTMHTTFHSAVTYLKTEIGRLFPDGGKGSRKCNISSTNMKGKKKMINGVDCSDLTRWFSKEEFQKLPGYMRKRISMNKAHQNKNKSQIQQHKKAKVNSVETTGTTGSTDGEDENQNRLVAAMINGIVNASRHESSSTVQYPHNGHNATIAATSTQNRQPSSNESTTSAVTFDHLGNPL